jgi:hypothetical protein
VHRDGVLARRGATAEIGQVDGHDVLCGGLKYKVAKARLHARKARAAAGAERARKLVHVRGGAGPARVRHLRRRGRGLEYLRKGRRGCEGAEVGCVQLPWAVGLVERGGRRGRWAYAGVVDEDDGIVLADGVACENLGVDVGVRGG